MSYCEICNRRYSKSNYATSSKHLKSALHQNNLKKVGKEIAINPIHELILYNILQSVDSVKYSEILNFFSSFGIKAEIALRTIIKKLKDGDVIYKGDISSDYEQILEKILQIPKIDYPLTLSIKEAHEMFQFLGYKYPSRLIEHFNKIANKYPGFINLSSSKIGEPSDLITFKEIFIEQIKFHKNNNWDIR